MGAIPSKPGLLQPLSGSWARTLTIYLAQLIDQLDGKRHLPPNVSKRSSGLRLVRP